MKTWMCSSCKFLFYFATNFTYYLKLMLSFTIVLSYFGLDCIVINVRLGSLEGFRRLKLKLICGRMDCEAQM
jgi:hypothetical protein